uniref:Malectin domain-containing protein n=1 Tax=Panagrellus redivivus TaxID=6233 RepID=A0A7E4UN37_PANRE
MKYVMVTEETPVSLIPDPKWHIFSDEGVKPTSNIMVNLNTSHPVLRYCATHVLYWLFFMEGQPRTELLLLLYHIKGEHLLNVTLNGDEVFVNKKFYVKLSYPIPYRRNKKAAELFVRKRPGKEWFVVWATDQYVDTGKSLPDVVPYITVGNGNYDKPIHEWLHVTVNGENCYEARLKLVDGYIEMFEMRKTELGFSTEPYDDTFFSSTTTTTTTTTRAPSENQDVPSLSESNSAVKKASLTTTFVFVGCGIFVLIGSAVLAFLGYRLGQRVAKKQASKFIRPDESNASGTIDKGKPTVPSKQKDVVIQKTIKEASTSSKRKLAVPIQSQFTSIKSQKTIKAYATGDEISKS